MAHKHHCKRRVCTVICWFTIHCTEQVRRPRYNSSPPAQGGQESSPLYSAVCLSGLLPFHWWCRLEAGGWLHADQLFHSNAHGKITGRKVVAAEVYHPNDQGPLFLTANTMNTNSRRPTPPTCTWCMAITQPQLAHNLSIAALQKICPCKSQHLVACILQACFWFEGSLSLTKASQAARMCSILYLPWMIYRIHTYI